jgi:fructose-specific phosphotransferase system component IIB
LQGLALGPLLFLIYINGLPLNVKRAEMVLFVGDTNLLITERSENVLQHKVYEVIKKLQYWLKKKT